MFRNVTLAITLALAAMVLSGCGAGRGSDPGADRTPLPELA